MKEKFSPGAALAFIRNGEVEYATEICETTLYNYIYRDDVFLTLDEKHLHEKGSGGGRAVLCPDPRRFGKF